MQLTNWSFFSGNLFNKPIYIRIFIGKFFCFEFNLISMWLQCEWIDLYFIKMPERCHYGKRLLLSCALFLPIWRWPFIGVMSRQKTIYFFATLFERMIGLFRNYSLHMFNIYKGHIILIGNLSIKYRPTLFNQFTSEYKRIYVLHIYTNNICSYTQYNAALTHTECLYICSIFLLLFLRRYMHKKKVL